MDAEFYEADDAAFFELTDAEIIRNRAEVANDLESEATEADCDSPANAGQLIEQCISTRGDVIAGGEICDAYAIARILSHFRSANCVDGCVGVPPAMPEASEIRSQSRAVTAINTLTEWLRLARGSTHRVAHAQEVKDSAAAINESAQLVLCSLARFAPALLKVERLIYAAKVNLSANTMTKAIGDLIAAGYAHRPQGDRAGVTVTPAGAELARKLEPLFR